MLASSCPLKPSFRVLIALTLPLMGASSPQDFLDHDDQKLRISEHPTQDSKLDLTLKLFLFPHSGMAIHLFA